MRQFLLATVVVAFPVAAFAQSHCALPAPVAMTAEAPIKLPPPITVGGPPVQLIPSVAGPSNRPSARIASLQMRCGKNAIPVARRAS